MSAWTGFDASLSSQYGYAGAAYAFSNDIDSDGLIARIGFGGGQYKTDGNDSHWVDHYDLDVMLGYRANLGRSAVSFYAGGVFERHPNLRLVITETPGSWFPAKAVELDALHGFYSATPEKPLTGVYRMAPVVGSTLVVPCPAEVVTVGFASGCPVEVESLTDELPLIHGTNPLLVKPGEENELSQTSISLPTVAQTQMAS